MLHLNKKFVSLLLIFSLVGFLRASDQTTDSSKQEPSRECVLSSMIVGGSIGALCGLLDRKLAPSLFSTIGDIITCLRVNDVNVCPPPDLSCVSSVPFTWLGSCVVCCSLIWAIHHERGSSRETRNVAFNTASVSSWISWAIVYSRLIS